MIILIPANCTFSQSFCGWRNLLDSWDQFNWSLRKNETPSLGTGPAKSNHTGNPEKITSSEKISFNLFLFLGRQKCTCQYERCKTRAVIGGAEFVGKFVGKFSQERKTFR